MVSNYVKQGLIKNPVKKLYDREQIAYLIFIALAKSVLSLDDIRLLFELQDKSYPPRRAYEYFAAEVTNVLHYVFGLKDTLDNVGVDNTEEKTMLRNTIFTVALKIYLDTCFAVIHEEK
jgi:DNA-binding transcriptional MerR regulator